MTVDVRVLKRSVIKLPPIMFTQNLSPIEFGARVLAQLSSPEGLGEPLAEWDEKQRAIYDAEERIAVLGEAFCGELSPIEIAVYCYLVFNPIAGKKEIVKRRKLTDKLVQVAIDELVDWGFIAYVDEDNKGNGFKLATLEDLYAVSA